VRRRAARTPVTAASWAILLTLLLCLPALAGCAGQAPAAQGPVADVSVHDTDGLNGILLDRPYHVPQVRLRSTSDGPLRLTAVARGRPLTLVFFGYTNCPDICQVVMANIASALVRLDKTRRTEVGMVFVTTDPARDTPAVLRSYVDRFDHSFEGATGPLPRIVRLGKAFGVPIEKGHRLASGGYDVVHGTQVVGLRPDGTAPFVWTEGTSPAALADDLTKILEDKVHGQ
jgi:protein SCO1